MSLKILVIDDDADYTALMQMRLESWGHRPTVTNNWLAAMLQTERNEFDLMIIDVETPTGNGLTACKDLCVDPRIASTPKVFITGRADDATLQQCEQLDAWHIQKSSTVFDQLKQLIQNIETSQVPTCC